MLSSITKVLLLGNTFLDIIDQGNNNPGHYMPRFHRCAHVPQITVNEKTCKRQVRYHRTDKRIKFFKHQNPQRIRIPALAKHNNTKAIKPPKTTIKGPEGIGLSKPVCITKSYNIKSTVTIPSDIPIFNINKLIAIYFLLQQHSPNLLHVCVHRMQYIPNHHHGAYQVHHIFRT